MKRKTVITGPARNRMGTRASRSRQKGQTAFEYLLLLGAVLLIVLLVNIVMRSTATKTDNKIKDELVTVDNLLTLCTNDKNTVKNAGFETDFDAVVDWTFTANNPGPNSGRLAGIAHKGAYTFYCNINSGTTICQVEQTVPLTASDGGKKTTASIWGKIEGTGPDVNVNLKYYGPTLAGPTYSTKAKYKLGGWTLFQTTGTIPTQIKQGATIESVDHLVLQVQMGPNGGNGEIWLDDVCYSIR